MLDLTALLDCFMEKSCQRILQRFLKYLGQHAVTIDGRAWCVSTRYETWPHAMIPLTKSPEQGDPGMRFLFLTPAAEGSRPYSRTICPQIVLVLSTCSPFQKEDGSAAFSGLLCLFSRLLLQRVSTVHSEAVHTPRIFSLIIRCWCMQHSQ